MSVYGRAFLSKLMNSLIGLDPRTSRNAKPRYSALLEEAWSPQQGDFRLQGPLSGQDAGGGSRTRDRRIPADLRADVLATVPPTPLVNITEINSKD
ncbi:hypothetical protein PoB_001562500 [Plakobranchus ocellatus]|uniref:Uncharacterized protein n=1 Tax=Plakobranchus ocellatus TaxID=259542 RepID=A0AAV3Z150_9GAST|nr:hypothetical protein PoB_001562500 [Plakobranchus ocellatus]